MTMIVPQAVPLANSGRIRAGLPSASVPAPASSLGVGRWMLGVVSLAGFLRGYLRRGGLPVRIRTHPGDATVLHRDVRGRRQPGAGLPSGRQVNGIANGRGEGTPAPGLTVYDYG